MSVLYMYSFTPDSSEACEGKVPCLRTQNQQLCHSIQRGETSYFSENPAPSGVRNRTA